MEQHTLEKIVEIGEWQVTSKANAQAFQTMNVHLTVINAIRRQYNTNVKCKSCRKNHHKGNVKYKGWFATIVERGHIAKECISKQKLQQNNLHTLLYEISNLNADYSVSYTYLLQGLQMTN